MHFGVQFLVKNFEVAGLDADYVVFVFKFNLEKLLQDVVAVFEVGVVQLEFEFNKNVVVFVVH
jgi:hypothetical protein